MGKIYLILFLFVSFPFAITYDENICLFSASNVCCTATNDYNADEEEIFKVPAFFLVFILEWAKIEKNHSQQTRWKKEESTQQQTTWEISCSFHLFLYNISLCILFILRVFYSFLNAVVFIKI